MAFKLSLVADVREWLKGTKDVEKSLDDIADSLDELADETKQNADKAADSLSREFSEAFDKVKSEANTAGKKVGDELKDGSRRASEGIEELGDEARSTAKEAAASFDGSAESIIDSFQEIAANAFAGFGPAGVAAGVAAGVGIGLVSASMEEAAEKAEATRERIADIATELDEVDGVVSELDWDTKLRDLLFGDVGGGQLWIEKYGEGLRRLGIDQETFFKAMTGDMEALNVVQQRRIEVYKEEERLLLAGDHSAAQRITQTNQTTNAIAAQNEEVNKANKLFHDSEDAAGNFAEAQRRAQEASEEFSDSLTDNLSVADEGLDDFVKKGKLNLDEWTRELERRQKQNAHIKTFLVDVAPELSPEALENFAKLPVETQNQIANAFNDGSKKDKNKIVANLEAEASIDKVTINPADATTVEIPTTVVTTGLPAEVAKASNVAQVEANRPANDIEFTTKIDTAKLQRAVNAAAANITAPTVYVNVKVRKEVP